MGWKKYQYYVKSPRSEIVKDILYWLLTAGAVYLTASSPYFISGLFRSYQKWKNYPRKKVCDTFSRLRRQGLIETRIDGNQVHIVLTAEGRKKAGYLQINDLKIKKPKTWDGKWRIVIFDIAELKKKHREAFRGKLKELGFRLLQKSVWLHPFDCEAEVDLMRDFFGLNKDDLRLIVAEKVEDDAKIREWFKV